MKQTSSYTALINFSDPSDAKKPRLKVAFGTPVQWLIANSAEELNGVINAAHDATKKGFWVVGAIKYEAASALDSGLFDAVHAETWPLAWFAVFDKALDWPSEIETEASIEWPDLAQTKQSFNQNFYHIQNRIEQGEFYQVNYTAKLSGQLSTPSKTTAPAALQLFSAMHLAQANGYAAYFDIGHEQFASVSPELFFEWKSDGTILTRPMKGTAKRGTTTQSDDKERLNLIHSPKERAENVMIVDLLRNDLSRIALPHSVQVSRMFHAEALPSVWQMTSDVTAITRPNTTLSDVFTALFPCGSITGMPKRQSMRTILELEQEPRGIYCGAIGVIQPSGAAIFNVAIRTVSIKFPSVSFGFGSAITWDSTADGEWGEWLSKKKFLDRASVPFDLLDSLAMHDGKIKHIPEHLKRLESACKHFNYPFLKTKIIKALNQISSEKSKGDWRLRVTIKANGVIAIQCIPLEKILAPVKLCLAQQPILNSQDEFVRFKTTRRLHYEALDCSNEVIFDTILWNEKGEITECTRGNLAVLLDDQWLTPALSCGLLNGIGRGVAIQDGRIKEAVIKKEWLIQAQEIAFLNDTRGWISGVLATM
jgi:para-aminobenzoate synthetase / 4-amino-4-deoxychorismate lyase